MYLKKFTFNIFGVNTYILWNETKEAAIIDPGMMSDAENDIILEFINQMNLRPSHLINTHMHIDHIAGNNFVEQKYGLVAECNADDEYLAENVKLQAEMFGFPYKGNTCKIGKYLNENDIISIGDEQLRILHVPGHTRGHIAVYSPNMNYVIAGDVLFRMSIGRTDLPGGDFNVLLDSIRKKLLTLPRNTIVYPGHGDKTTIGYEIDNNPFLTE